MDEEDRKVAAGMRPKGYSNALSSGCWGKLKTIQASLEESENRIDKEDGMGEGEERRRTGFLKDGLTSEKHYTLFMSFVPTHVLF